MTETAGAKVLRKLDGVSSPFFFSSRRRHTRCGRDWSSDVCSSDLELYKELDAVQQKLEDHYKDMQDMEFTIQSGKLWILQTRSGKRTAAAMVKIAMDLLREGKIDEKTALLRLEPNKLDELLRSEEH